MTQVNSTPDWTHDLPQVSEIAQRTHRGCVRILWTATIDFHAWAAFEPSSLALNCRKGSSLVTGQIGKSCPEVEVVHSLRRRGWKAFWMKSFRCGPEEWQSYRGEAVTLPSWIISVLKDVRERREIALPK